MTAKQLEEERRVLMLYLHSKMESEDWHGVADAAMDLRECDAKLSVWKDFENMKDNPINQTLHDFVDRTYNAATEANVAAGSGITLPICEICSKKVSTAIEKFVFNKRAKIYAHEMCYNNSSHNVRDIFDWR